MFIPILKVILVLPKRKNSSTYDIRVLCVIESKLYSYAILDKLKFLLVRNIVFVCCLVANNKMFDKHHQHINSI